MKYLHSTPPFPALPDARDSRDKPPPAPLLAAAVHAQSEGVVITARRWTRGGFKIIFANESFCAMTGFTVAELRQRGHGSLHEDKADLARLQLWQHDLRPGATFSGEGNLERKNGSRLYAAWTFCPVSNDAGDVTHIVGTYRDLTEKRRLQDELIHSHRLDAVGRLAGGVAHDFNNLLSVINGYCEIMATKRGVRRQAAKELEEIHQASQKAASLVRQLLAFSRRQAMNPKVINLNQLIRENSEILGRLLKPNRSLERFSLEADSINVRIDPAQLQQVLLNLTINARDAMPEGGQVSICTTLSEVLPGSKVRPAEMPAGRYALLSVSDTGEGMDANTQAHLFEPFFTTKEQGKGTGLGLALVYGVVQQSGGFIFVRSEVNSGSTFDIYLPEVREPAQSIVSPLPCLPDTRGCEAILIVEEDDMIRKMVSGILTADGYTVISMRTASEGQAAVLRRRRAIDLLITQMGSSPGNEGELLVRTLSAKFSKLRVLGTCSSECPPLPFLSADAQIMLTKPFTLSALLKATRALLDGKNGRELTSVREAS